MKNYIFFEEVFTTLERSLYRNMKCLFLSSYTHSICEIVDFSRIYELRRTFRVNVKLDPDELCLSRTQYIVTSRESNEQSHSALSMGHGPRSFLTSRVARSITSKPIDENAGRQAGGGWVRRSNASNWQRFLDQRPPTPAGQSTGRPPLPSSQF